VNARDVARRAIRRALDEGAYATLALGAELERAGLDRRDAGFATELAYSTLRHLRRIDRALEAYTKRPLARTSPEILAIMRVGACELLAIDSVPDRAAVNEAASAARRIGGPRVAGFVNAVLRKLARDGEPPLPDDPRSAIAIEHSLPDWLVDLLAAQLEPGELEAAARSLSAAPAVGLRANLMRIDRDALIDRLRAEAPGAEIAAHPLAATAISARRLGAPDRLPSFAEGLFSVQDPSAQRVVELARPEEAGSILDACAGVGGKACHLAERTGDRVAIDAADISARKLDRLREAAARLGLETIRPVVADLLDPDAPLADTYDLVVVDAPCTGLGVLRRHPEAKWRLDPGAVARMAELQARLLDAAAARVAPGGALVYAVCSVAAAEGPAQIAALAGRRADLTATASEIVWPHRDDADGFFMARLERR
jgi:16S rRNA (cytosine967-C5)-methyltransferase